MESGRLVNRSRDLIARVRRRAAWAVRDRFPRRKVVRQVQGVEMVLPWSHRLPDYTAEGSEYGQNLVQVCRELSRLSTSLNILDVGANVGDSALQILAAVDARILCVEGDDSYLEFLHINVGSDPRVEIEESLVSSEPDDGSRVSTAVRSGGTTRFVRADGGDTLRFVTPAELRELHPQFRNLRLIKSDTDGSDVDLVPALAEEWCDDAPVLFFEYDHALSRAAGHDPLRVWPRLAALGYTDVAVWDQGGRPLGSAAIGDMPRHVGILDRPIGWRSQHYWDVAAIHGTDSEARRAVLDLVPGRLSDARETHG